MRNAGETQQHEQLLAPTARPIRRADYRAAAGRRVRRVSRTGCGGCGCDWRDLVIESADFLRTNPYPAFSGMFSIITNPPYDKAEQFVRYAAAPRMGLRERSQRPFHLASV